MKLIQACENGNLELIKQLVQEGADLHTNDDYALGVAALNGHLAIVKFLVQHGANVHAGCDLALRYARSPSIVDYLKQIIRKEKIEELNVS